VVHVVGALVNVYKVRVAASLTYGFGGCNKSVGDRDDDLTGFYACCHKGESQSIRATADAYAVLRSAEACEILFKALDHRPANETGGMQCFAKDSDQVFFQFPVRGDQVEKWDFHHMALEDGEWANGKKK
jgi:diadenosine tetraphosphatase ApaH/serine/threonine PP2A family protein phosphatase